MKARSLSWTGFVVIGLATLGFGRQSVGEPTQPQAVSFSGPKALAVKGAGVNELKIEFKVAEGMHIQSNPADRPLVATSLVVFPNKDLEVFSPKYPAGKRVMISGLKREISTYEGTLSLSVPMRVSKSAKSKASTLEGELRYQACDSTVCYPPTKLALSLPVHIQK